MARQLTKEDIMKAKAIHLYNENTIYVELNDEDNVYGSYKGGEWFVKGNFWDYFESEIMMSYFQTLTPEEALKMLEKWEQEYESEVQAEHYRLNKAIIFATEKHSGQVRKSTTIPYILHPLEVMQILYSMRADNNLLIAGVLHDTVEDTDTTLSEIREIFGDDVAELVASNSEDKSKSWDERKKHTIEELATAEKRVKMLIMADKTSNIRSIAHDYKNIGDNVWKRFNAPKEKQAWYYGGIQDALSDMGDDKLTASVYWEMVGLFKDVFVKFYFDKTDKCLYQICDDGTGYVFEYEHPVWVPLAEKQAVDIAKGIFDTKKNFTKTIENFLTDEMLMPRKEAELTEDIWYREYREKSMCDEYNIGTSF